MKVDSVCMREIILNQDHLTSIGVPKCREKEPSTLGGKGWQVTERKGIYV